MDDLVRHPYVLDHHVAPSFTISSNSCIQYRILCRRIVVILIMLQIYEFLSQLSLRHNPNILVLHFYGWIPCSASTLNNKLSRFHDFRIDQFQRYILRRGFLESKNYGSFFQGGKVFSVVVAYPTHTFKSHMSPLDEHEHLQCLE